MQCVKCGSRIEAGDKCCPHCGSAVVKPVKAHKSHAWLIAVFAILLVLIAGVIWKYDAIGNLLARTFNKPEAYYQRVEKRHMKAQSDRFIDEAKTLQALMPQSDFSDLLVQLRIDHDNIDAEVEELLAATTGMAEDFSWLETVGIKMTTGMEEKDQLLGGNAAIVLNNEEIIGADFCWDIEDGRVYANIPVLSDEAFYTDIEAVEGSYEDFADLITKMHTREIDIKKLERAQALMLKYANIALKHVDDVEKSKETIEAGELNKNCIVLTVKLSGEEIHTITTDILETMKDDKELKRLVEDTAKEILPSAQADEVWGDMLDRIDELLEKLEDTEPDDIDITIDMDVYVDGAGNIIGRKIHGSADGEEFAVCSVIVSKGSDFGCEFTMGADRVLKIVGNGEMSAMKRNADIDFTVTFSEGKQTEKIADAHLSVKKDGKTPRFQLDIVPDENLLEKAIDSMGSLPDPLRNMMETASLRVTGNGNSKESFVSIALCADKKEILSYECSVKAVNKIKLATPKDSMDMDTWMSNMDIGKAIDIVERLSDAGVPASLLAVFGGAGVEHDPVLPDPIDEPEVTPMPEPIATPVPEATKKPVNQPSSSDGVLRAVDATVGVDPVYIEANAKEYWEETNPAPFGAWVKCTSYNATSHNYETIYWRLVEISTDAQEAIDAYNEASTWRTYDPITDTEVQWYKLSYQMYYPETWPTPSYGFTSPGIDGFAKNPKGGAFSHNGIAYLGLGQLYDLFPGYNETHYAGDLVMHTAIFDMLIEEPEYVFQIDGGMDAAGNYISAYANSR